MFKELALLIVSLIFLVTFVLLMLVVLPLVAIQLKLEQRKLRLLAERFVCVRCGGTIGGEAIQLADERWEEMSEERRRLYPKIKFRLVRNLQALCPHCSCEYCYQEAEDKFIVRESNRGQELLAPSLGSDWIE